MYFHQQILLFLFLFRVFIVKHNVETKRLTLYSALSIWLQSE